MLGEVARRHTEEMGNISDKPRTISPTAAPFGTKERTDTPEHLYLGLLKQCLTRIIFEDTSIGPKRVGAPLDPAVRAEGRDWPAAAETMIGLRALDNLED